MKKTIYFLYLLGIILTCKNLGAQVPNFNITNQLQCFIPTGGNSSTAMVGPLIPGATSYSWSASAPNCTASVMSYSNGTMAILNYPCCGIFTVTCTGYNPNSIPILSLVKTVTVTCSSTISVSGPGSVCSGNSAILHASGASNYTWIPGGFTGDSIVVTPSVTTCYTVTGLNISNGCNTAPAIKCVTVVPALAISVTGNTVICTGSSSTLTAHGASSYTWYTSQGNFSGSTIVLTPAATTCYTLAGANALGCSAYASGCVVVSSNSTTPVISGNFNICRGQSTTLIASGATSYTWLPGGIVGPYINVSPSVTTCYTLVGYSCFNMNSTVRCVTVTPNPTITVTGNTTVCAGSSATLTASGASSYVWTTGVGTFTGSTIVITPTATTCYSVVGSNNTNCTGSAGGCITISSGTPNPVISGNFNIFCGASQSTTLFASGASSYTWLPGGIVSSSISVSPSVTTCYTLVGYSCYNLAPAVRCVTVGASPIITVSGNGTVCAGSGTSLTASGASTYIWYTSQGTFSGSTIVLTPTATTCYTVVGSNGPNCNGYAAGCVSVFSPTTTPVISGNFNLSCGGQSTTLFASGASSYTWLPGGIVSPSIIVSPSVTTCYTLVGYSCFNLGSTARCVTVTPAPIVAVTGNTAVCAGSSTTLTASGASTYIWSTTVGTFTGSSIVITPTATTCYTVIGSNGPNCNGYALGCVYISTVAPNPLISGNFNTCGGQSTTLFASGASSYTWLPGGIVSSSISVTPSVTTCYTLVGYSCFNLASAVRCVTVGSSPVISVSGNSVICSGNGATLTASGASSYVWYTSMGTFTGSTIVLTPTATTCYTLVGSNGPNCNGYAAGCVSVSSGTPNPVISGNFNTCGGQSTTLFASGASSYTWLPGGVVSSSITVSPSVTTCYTLVGYSCFNLASAVRCVTVGSSPVISVSGNSVICSGNGATLTASGASSYVWYTSMGTFTGSTIVLTPTATTCYTLVGSNGPNCNGYAAGCVSVSSGTPNPVISGNFNTCGGQSTTLFASGAFSYTWLPGGVVSSSISVTPSVTTCYTLVGYSCFNLASAVRCVTVGSSPVISVSGNSVICSGNGATLTASGASSYVWYTSMGTFTGSTIVLTPTATTCYTLVGSNGPNCNGYAAGCVSVSSGTPNPVISGNFNICGGGQSTTLFASGASSYTWLPGGIVSSSITVSPSVTTCYTLVGYSCFNLASAVRCVTVGSSPVISVSGNTAICIGHGATLTASGASSYTWFTSQGTFTGSTIVLTPSATSCYSLVGSNGPNCNGYTGGCISVMGSPTLTVSGNLSICSGATGFLSASGATSYTWIPGNITSPSIAINPTVSTCYTVVGTNANGCVSVANRCIQVIPRPTITTVNPGVICAGNMVTLTAIGASSYTWAPYNLTGQSIVISPTVGTCYTVTGSNGSGCTNSAVGCFSVMPSPVITISGNSVICAGMSTSLQASGANSYTWIPNNVTGAGVVVSPTASTCYTVFGINNFGCSSQAVKCVSVTQGAFLNISGGGNICAGSSANLLAFGANTYTWNTGSNSPFITVSPTASTCYTVTGTTAQGCVGSAAKCFSVLASPNVYIYRADSIHGGDSTVCPGTPITLVATGATNYTWSTGSTTYYTNDTPNITTTYFVIGTFTNGCSSTNIITVPVSLCSGIFENRNTLEIGMYPNPSSGQLTLRGDGINTINYSIYDVIGRELVKGKFTDVENLDLSGYANGSYVVRFESGSASSYKKLVIEK